MRDVGLRFINKYTDWQEFNSYCQEGITTIKMTTPSSSSTSSSSSSNPYHVFRNVFAFEDEDPAWQKELQKFPNRVPRFESKAECINFTKQHWGKTSNPDVGCGHFQHAVSTLVSWSQIETYLLPKIQEYELRWPSKYMQSTTDRREYLAELVNDMKENNVYFQAKTRLEEQHVLPQSNVLDDLATPTLQLPPFASPKEMDEDLADDVGAVKMLQYMQSRLNLKIHQQLSEESRLNTLKYLFFHMKCGIYVMIRNRQVKVFCPFVNKDYRNNWAAQLKLNCSDQQSKTYAQERAQYLSNVMHRDVPEDKFLPKDQWWANGNVICNMYSNEDSVNDSQNQYWGDHFLFQLKDMFQELAFFRDVPDCEFFINKRDYPQLKFNPTMEQGDGTAVEPYGFLFDKDDRKPEEDIVLSRFRFKSYAPIMSFYSSDRFADLPIPPTEDWSAATGEIFPDSFIQRKDKHGKVSNPDPKDLFTTENLLKFEVPWSQKEPTAFFRGSATGGGVTIKNNQRLQVSHLHELWRHVPELNGNKGSKYPYLDAKITGWNLRDKKVADSAMTFVHMDQFDFEGNKHNRIPIYEQSKYKYILYIEGHCAACRYGFMMMLNSVILKVKSRTVADSMWYFPLLRDGYDHIEVKEDFSDLQEKIEWCRSHDAECKQIAENAKRLYDKFVSKEGLLDYLQAMLVEISLRQVSFPSFLDPDDEWWTKPSGDDEEVAEEIPAALCVAKAKEVSIAGRMIPRAGEVPLHPTLKSATKEISKSVALKRYREHFCCVDNSSNNNRHNNNNNHHRGNAEDPEANWCFYCREAKRRADPSYVDPAAIAAAAASNGGEEKKGLRNKKTIPVMRNM